jgi:hypothetical protein
MRRATTTVAQGRRDRALEENLKGSWPEHDRTVAKNLARLSSERLQEIEPVRDPHVCGAGRTEKILAPATLRRTKQESIKQPAVPSRV